MTLAAGTRLGPYEILSPLGAGGMGEVYRARDPRLGRDVAIKVLPLEVASDKERLKRFEKEARSASGLNHPNIVTIYETGSSDGLPWIAMEHVEGETLRTLVSNGPLQTKKLLNVAVQIAEGLARAHEAGIVHRDLKPENVMVKKDGLVKILDFGLAKLSPTTSGSDEGSNLPTMTGTTPGVVVGTVGYMSPEQASGLAVDFRSDQFSFGSILYEMATGRRAFHKKTTVDTLAAILNEEPEPIGSINHQTPPPLRWLVERCLSKEPDNRYVATRDLARDLGTIQGHLSDALSGGTALAGGRRRQLSIPLGMAVVLAAVVAAVSVFGTRWLVLRGAKPVVPSFRQLTFRRGNLFTARFAPDGKTVVYAAAWDGAPAEVFTVRTDSVASTSIGLANADLLSVSSKGELAIQMNRKRESEPEGAGTLARAPLTGGTPRELLADVLRADWAPNGDDLAVVRAATNGVRRVEYPIGTVLYETRRRTESLGSLRVSPDGNLVAFPSDTSIVIVDRKGRSRVISGGWEVGAELAWSPRGDELIICGRRGENEKGIYAVRLAGQLRVLVNNAFGLELHDVSSDGRLLVESFQARTGILYLAKGQQHERELGWQFFSVLRGISPDGRFILFGILGSDPGGIYLRKTDGSPPSRLGDGIGLEISSDSQWVLALLSGPPRQLVLIPTGAGVTKKITIEGLEPLWARLLPKGEGVVVRADGKDGKPLLAVVGQDGARPRVLKTEGLHGDFEFVVSPDGDRVAYVTTDRQLRIVSIRGEGTTTVPGDRLREGEAPIQWSSDGGYLHLVTGNEIIHFVERLEISTGRRDPWRRVMPDDGTALLGVGPVFITPDGQSYAYGYTREFIDDLFVVDGTQLAGK